MVEGGDLGDSESFRDGHYSGVCRAEREVGVGVDEVGHALVVVEFEVHDGDRLLRDRSEKRALDPGAASTTEQVSDLRDDQRRYQNRPPREVQAREEVGAGTVVRVVTVCGRDERTGVADDHSGASEALGEQIVVIAAEIVAAAGEGAEPRGRPRRGGPRFGLAAGFGEHGRNPVVGQLLDEPLQLIPLSAHAVQGIDRRAGWWEARIEMGRGPAGVTGSGGRRVQGRGRQRWNPSWNPDR